MIKSLLPGGIYWAMEPTHFMRMLEWTRANVPLIKVEASTKIDDQIPLQISNGMGVIRIRGVMDKSPSFFLSIFGGCSTMMIRRAVEEAARNDDVEEILLIIDSPGGSVDGLAELADAVMAARKEKPVIAQVDGMAASAAYAIASQAHFVYAQRMDLIGSIGTRIWLYDYSKMFAEEGIEAVPIDTGEFKSAGMEGTVITKNQRADFQRIVDAYFDDFLNSITRGRNMARKDIEKVADGRIFTADEAIKNNLIDGISTVSETMSRIRAAQNVRRAANRNAADVAIRFAELE